MTRCSTTAGRRSVRAYADAAWGDEVVVAVVPTDAGAAGAPTSTAVSTPPTASGTRRLTPRR